jgi:hypothetical protein
VSQDPRGLAGFLSFYFGKYSDPDVLLKHFDALWKQSDNPYWVWEAVNLCAEHERQFPDWVRHYLNRCAARMMKAANSKTSKDFREVLPHALGFRLKRGRGHPLRPDGDAYEYVHAAYEFAIAILNGSKPTDALHKASTVLPRPLADKITDKTLRDHIKKLFGVKNAPRTNADWHEAILLWHIETFAPDYRGIPEIHSRISDVT